MVIMVLGLAAIIGIAVVAVEIVKIWAPKRLDDGNVTIEADEDSVKISWEGDPPPEMIIQAVKEVFASPEPPEVEHLGVMTIKIGEEWKKKAEAEPEMAMAGEGPEQIEDPPGPERQEVFLSIRSLNLPVRARHALEENQITTINELRKLSERELRDLKRVGPTYAHRIKTAMASAGFPLPE